MQPQSERSEAKSAAPQSSLNAAALALFSSPQKRTWVLSLLLAAATLALYDPIVHNGFINYDDDVYVTGNRNIQQGLTWSTVKWAFTSSEAANWHPLTWLAHALDWQLFHNNPAGHHYVSVLLHAVNAILLFLLFQRATGFTWRSLAVAALFALHPVNVESVAWVAERKNVLSMMFFLLAMLAYDAYARRPSIRGYGLVALLFTLGLMAKPQVITLPCVLLLWDYWPLGRLNFSSSADQPAVSARRLILEKIPLFLLALASAVITMHAQRRGSATRTLEQYSLYDRIGNGVISYARYLGHAFWPLHLSPAYPHPGNGIPPWHIIAASVFLLLATTLVLLSRKRYLIAGWLWFLGTLVPMVGVIQVGDQAMADRYAYIPFIGLFWMAVWGIADAAHMRQVNPRWLAAPAFAVILACVWIAHRQLDYWHDSITLWRYALSVTDENFIAHSNLARALAAENQIDEAIKEFTQAEQSHNYDLADLLHLGDYETRTGHYAEAALTFERVLRSTQDPQIRKTAFTGLGVADAKTGNLAEAKGRFESALQLDPQNSAAFIGLGLLAYRGGDMTLAADYFSRSVHAKPTDVGYLLLATALQTAGRQAEADSAYAAARQISPDLTQTRQIADQYLF